jgi:lipase chaperone LimK
MAKRVNAELLKLDRRIINRKLLTGELSEKELVSLLKKLPDVSEDAELITLQDNEKQGTC